MTAFKLAAGLRGHIEDAVDRESQIAGDAVDPQIAMIRNYARHVAADQKGGRIDSADVGKAAAPIAARMVQVLAPHVGGGRTDAHGVATPGRLDTYYAQSTLAEYTPSPIRIPKSPLEDLLGTVPVRMVPAGAEDFRLRFVDGSFTPALHTPGTTVYSRVNVQSSERKAPLYAFAGELDNDWLRNMRDGFAGFNRASEQMYALNRGFDEFIVNKLMLGTGIAGTALRTLSTVGMFRYDSAVSIAGATAIATLYADLLGAAQLAGETSAARISPDTALVSDRIWNRLGLSTNLATGGDVNARQKIVEEWGAMGITRIVRATNLRNFGGANRDAVIFLSTGEDGLAHALGMRPAPVWNYAGSNGQNTVYAMITGGLELPIADNGLVYTALIA